MRNGLQCAAGVPVLQFSSLFEIAINTLFSLILLPIPISIAILCYRLWDIDTIINKALVYGVLTLLLVLVYAGLIIGLQFLLGTLMKPNNDAAIVISTLAMLPFAVVFSRSSIGASIAVGTARPAPWNPSVWTCVMRWI
jgi:hypothetical protein